MEIKSVNSGDFTRYGKVVEGYDFTGILDKLTKTSEKPTDSVIYVPGDTSLEAMPVAAVIRDNLYGGLPIQIGYCNGYNRMLNCLEYHRGSEVNIAADDAVLLLAPLQEVQEGRLDTGSVEAFLVPAGTAVLLYETTLHYAPCNAPEKDGFRVIIVLPKDTNTEKPEISVKNGEDRLLWARNKWLIAHPDAPEAKQGAFVGLAGTNITV